MSGTRGSRSSSVRDRRRARKRAIILAARGLLDARGRRDASVDEIARAAGLSKALVYRAFDSKEEIFLLTLTDYLAELRARSDELAGGDDPVAVLREICGLYADFCLEYPAFLDCALALMQRPASELREDVSGMVWLRLGGALADCVGPLERVLASGSEQGLFSIEDPALTANRTCVQILGTMHLARSGVGVRELAPGVGGLFEIDEARVRDACVEDTLALARIAEVAAA